jgi:hypothetical protein
MIKLRNIKWAGSVASMRERRGMILTGKLEGKRPLGRPRCWCNGNIKMDRRKIRWDDMDWIDLAQDRDQWRTVVNTVMEVPVP